MAAPSSGRSNGPVVRSLSPSEKFYSSPARPSQSSAFASYSSSFSARSSTLFHRPASPTRVNLYGTTPSAPSVRFSLDRPNSPSRSISALKKPHQKRTCMCAPTSHLGSFRCSLHKNFNSSPQHSAVPYSSNRLNARRSAMTNSLVRIGTVEGDLMKRALASLIRPSSHHQRRRADFQPRASRLSIMSKAEDLGHCPEMVR